MVTLLIGGECFKRNSFPILILTLLVIVQNFQTIESRGVDETLLSRQIKDSIILNSQKLSYVVGTEQSLERMVESGQRSLETTK